MNKNIEQELFLRKVLGEIGEYFKDSIWSKSKEYCLIDIGNAAKQLELQGDASPYEDVNAIIPLKKADKGIGIFVNGNELSDYCQLDSGIVVPEWIAKDSGLPHKQYKPHPKMTLYM